MRKMESNSPKEKNKDSGSQGMVSNKLDFLLDTIDTEVANLAEAVVTEGPILYETASGDELQAVGLNHEKTVADHRDLNIGLLERSGEPSSEVGVVDKETEAALDALRDAEGEVEAMLTAEGVARSTEDATLNVTDQETEDQPAAKTLAEFLATGEVDVASLFVKGEEHQEAAAIPPTADGELPEDLFSDLDTNSDSDDDTTPTSESAPTQLEAKVDPLSEPTLENANEDPQVKADKPSSTPTSPDSELAILMSNKIEALLTRLVEERLPDIAERIIVEKLNKIIASMK
jgi:hypothetical protein